MSAKWHAPSASATPWDEVAPGALTPAQRLVMDAHREAYDRLHDSDRAGDALFFNGYARRRCPRCGSERIVKNGHDRSGLLRWRCNSCFRDFTPVTGTIFEGRKMPVSDWVEFLLELFSYESVNEIVRQERRSPTTPPYWLAKVFAVLRGVQDGVVLGQELKLQIDETFYPIPLAEAERRPDGSLKPGLSRNRICIAVACEMRHKGKGGQVRLRGVRVREAERREGPRRLREPHSRGRVRDP